MKGPFETRIKDFFFRLWGYRVEIDIQVLDSDNFKKFNDKPKALAFVVPYRDKSGYLIQLKEPFDQPSLMHEILHIYRPDSSEEDVHSFDQILDFYYKIWEKLYDDFELREGFMDLLRPRILDDKELEFWKQGAQ